MRLRLPPPLVVLSASLVVAIAAASHADANPDPDPDPKAAWSALESLASGQQAITSYRAAFTQTKHSPLLNNPIVSTGHVQIAGGVARWDTAAPHATVMTLGNGVLSLYYPDQKTVEVYELGDRLDALATSPVPDLKTLREHFEPGSWNWDGGDSPFHLTLVPISASMREAIDVVAVTVDGQTGTLKRFVITDLDDEITEVVFRDAELNPAIDTASLMFEPPPDTRVVRPLDAAAP